MNRALHKCLLNDGGKNRDELLYYVAMGHKISKQKFEGYIPYFLMFVRVGSNIFRMRS